MGTWGLGTFEDDIACDWLEDLHDSDPIRFFVKCLDLEGHEDLEYLACIGVVCTAEILHALLRQPRRGLPEAACNWVDQHRDLNVSFLVPVALAGLRRVVDTESEMRDRWQDSDGQYEAWRTQTGDLIQRLHAVMIESV